MPLVYGALKVGLGLAGIVGIAGFGINQTAEGVDTLSKTLVKVAVVGGTGYLIMKKAKVI